MGETTTAANKAPVFGKGSGQLLLPVGTASDIAYSAFLQPDGKIVMAGRSWNGSDGDFSLVRLNPDGSLDSSFDCGRKAAAPGRDR